MVICLIILFNVSKKSAKYMVGNRIFKALVISTITLLILETASWLVDGRPGNTFFILNVSVNTALFAINPLPSILWYFYVNHQVNRQFRNVKKVIYVSAVILVVNSVLVITNIFTGTLFGIDSQNVYSRGPLFYFLIVTTYSIIAYTFFYLLINRKKVRKDELSPFLAFALPPVLGGVLQALFYGVSLIWSGVTISLLIIHTGIQQRQLDTDYLTGVYNRRQLENYLDGRIKASRNGKSFSGILIDVDDFKSINDEFGHAVGDEALIAAAKLLKDSLRDQDFISRYGGDEFVVIIDTADQAALKQAMERITRLADSFNKDNDTSFKLSFSIGSAIYDNTSVMNREQFIELIDSLMYKNKAARRAV